ncbi:hypothetical protein D1869_00955 [Sulfurisphaera ohwakuensis]|uniref:Uncharacterized protein n=1 Tax=Sulfurisphaera ohwakuensis TaxID=69656 RepID=A0A650CDQ2_SULOH|nr:hypothetical protein D1869_00955 [Sulfurisphaera ohwakuensis]
MVFEERCDSCGRFTETKYCGVKKINVCVDCCLLCNIRSKCELRVWFHDLVPIISVKGKISR